MPVVPAMSEIPAMPAAPAMSVSPTAAAPAETSRVIDDAELQ